MSSITRSSYREAFTIVELLIVIVVIAILAAVSLVAYNNIQNRASVAALQSDLKNAATKLGVINVDNNSYPVDLAAAQAAGLIASSSTTFDYTYTAADNSYCLTAFSTRNGITPHHITNTNSTPTPGACEGHTVPGGGNEGEGGDTTLYLQTITTANCPTTRTLAVDARDNHSYWVQKLADNRCWMLTNLAYAGGGTNTYGDVKTLTLTSGAMSGYTEPRYRTLASSNATTYPTEPSSSTDGGATNPQYGYLYNYCAAMGVQVDTAACLNSTTPAFNATISVCPSGWRLPTGSTGGEFEALNASVNGGLTTTDQGLREVWLMQYGGTASGSSSSLNYQGSEARYWSSTVGGNYNRALLAGPTITQFAGAHPKNSGYAVRCTTM